jgi:hypothetical protein
VSACPGLCAIGLVFLHYDRSEAAYVPISP